MSCFCFCARFPYFSLTIRPGQGALARHEDFWYPVRLIRKVSNTWIVQWWRENIYAAEGLRPGQVSTIHMKDITDSMWMDRGGRRIIRVSNEHLPSLILKDSLVIFGSLVNGNIPTKFQTLILSFPIQNQFHTHHPYTTYSQRTQAY